MTEQRTCASCGEENVPQAAFCMACGRALDASCPSCGASAPPQARFCISCGAALGGDAATASGATAAAAGTAAQEVPLPPEERRTVTVLFADISGYTAVAEKLDHETVKALVDRCTTRLAEEVTAFGGRVDKYIGDNVMAVFGAPVSHEDDPERAVRAALGMLAAMGELNRAISADHGFELALRVGVNTGEVLAGTVGDAYTVIGDAVNVASRLQTAAAVGTITVGERTQRATSEAIAYRVLEPLELKGKAKRVPAWEAIGVIDPSDGANRRARKEPPLIGRGEELAELELLLSRASHHGSAHLATVVGQAGVGKTRLLREFESALAQRDPPVQIRRGRCLPFGASVVYWPLSEMLRAECEILDGDSAELAASKLAARLQPLLATGDASAEQLARRTAPLARLLGIETAADTEAPEQEEAQSARETFFGAVRGFLEALAREGPLVLAWEDIHWADEGMLDLIDYLNQWLRAPVLQVGLARDELLERRPSWGASRRTARTLFLEPLALADTRELIGGMLREAGAAPELIDALADRAGGNPLFAEELVQRLVEAGDTEAAELPDTVQALLAARLDSLEPLERQLVAQAAVVGRTFWTGFLTPVAAVEGGDIQAALATLREKDIIVAGESASLAGEQELAFKHVLIRDVAYAMLPKAVRARKHYEVGAFIEQRAGERGEEVVALLAEHYGRAAALGEEVHLDESELEVLHAKALQFIDAAGDSAAALYSNQEALAHYEAAAALALHEAALHARITEKQGDMALRLGRVDEAIDVWQQGLKYESGRDDVEHEAELHRKIGAALAHKGERKSAIEHHQQGINLLKDRQPSLALVRLYEEASWLYMQVGDNMLAIYASEKALGLAERLGGVRAASRAHGIFGRVFGRIGDTVKARENLERAIALARDSDAGETVLALLALGHHLENAESDYASAAQAYSEALALGERIGDVPAQIELHAALALLAFYRCDWEQVRSSSDASAELAEGEGLVGKLCLSYTLRGMLSWRDGDWEASIGLFHRAHELAEQVGWSEVSFNSLFGLSVTFRDRGELAEAASAIEQALAVCQRAGLIAQALQANTARALILTLAGRHQLAREAADEAAALAERVRYPIGEAAALEARGITAELPEAVDLLRQGRAAWERLYRRLDVARCDLLLGQRLREHDPEAAAEALAAAAAAYDELGVRHLAERARGVVAAPT